MKKAWILATALIAAAPLAWADHRAPSPFGRLVVVAHELQEAAEHVHEAAERRAHHGDRWEEFALTRLHLLERRAERFQEVVERRGRDPWRLEREYRRLAAAYRDAEEALPYLHGDRHVRRDFQRVRRLMREVDMMFGAYDRYGYTPRW